MPDEIVTGRFNGFFRHKLDEKGRLPVPFRWKPEESVEFTLIKWRKGQFGTCLRALLPDQWAKLLADIEAMPNKDTKKTVLKRVIGTSSTLAKVDSVGRISIPDDMIEAAGLKRKGEVVLAGLINRFELWSPERYQRVEAHDNAVITEAMEDLE